MADDADLDLPWDVQTDDYISDIDAGMKDATVSVRELLLNPRKYMKKAGSAKTVGDVRKRVDVYFGELLDGMADQRQAFVHELESLNAQYMRMDQVIENKAAALKVPYIKPTLVEINQDLREEITIDQYSESVDTLIAKLLSNATYVADLSAEYEGNMLGSWLFSSGKPYVLTLRQPESVVMNAERSHALIEGMLNEIQNQYT